MNTFISFLTTFGIVCWLGLFAFLGCQGKQGPVGPAGEVGPPGIQGVAGLDETQIRSVQFCPGFAPTQYPEVGLCIDGKLYAEWYAPPSSGLVYLPDGTYQSTQTGAACTFSVSGCEVSP